MKKSETERRVYTKEFKAEAAALAQKREKPVSQVAKDLGVNESMLRKWMSAAKEAAASGGRHSPGAGTRRTRSCPAFARRTRPCARQTKY